jgi:hypothetical protein
MPANCVIKQRRLSNFCGPCFVDGGYVRRELIRMISKDFFLRIFSMKKGVTLNTIEDKLSALAECGFKLKDPFSVSDLIESWGRKSLDEDGFNLTLVCLGMTEECPPWTPHCDTLWHFDTECIEGDGSYVAIGKRMAEMAQGSLPLSDFTDHIDIDQGKAWLQFQCRDKLVHIDCKVQDDWVDAGVFGKFVDLLALHDPEKLFIYYDLGGQDCIIGCATRNQFEKLKKLIPNVKPLA